MFQLFKGCFGSSRVLLCGSRLSVRAVFGLGRSFCIRNVGFSFVLPTVLFCFISFGAGLPRKNLRVSSVSVLVRVGFSLVGFICSVVLRVFWPCPRRSFVCEMLGLPLFYRLFCFVKFPLVKLIDVAKRLDKLEKLQHASVESTLCDIHRMLASKSPFYTKDVALKYLLTLKMEAKETKHSKAGLYSAVLEKVKEKTTVSDDHCRKNFQVLLGDKDQERSGGYFKGY